MIDVGFDFTGRHVLVTGGTRGLGLAVATAFADTGARVSVTGTKILPSLYDADLGRFDYHQLQLTSSDAIESFVERIGSLDVLVNAAGARLSSTMDEHEREFLCHSARLGFVGPQRLTQQLRSRLFASTAPSGGVVVHTSYSAHWLELTQTPADAENELRAQTTQAGRAWSRLGARVNTVLSPVRPNVPAQAGRFSGAGGLGSATGAAGTVLVRPRAAHSVSTEQVATIIQFMASAGASGLTGQTVRADARR